MKTKNIIGAIIGIGNLSLIWYWFSWKLALVIFLALLSNNLEQSKK